MASHSRFLIWSACAVMLVIACLAAGCSSTQAPVSPTATTPVPAGSANAVTMKNFAFSPATLTIKTGTAVVWTNNDAATHTIVSDAGAPVAFSSDPLANGASFTFTFTLPGSYPYHCSIHPSMKGTVIVQS